MSEGGERSCFECRQVGHLARDCPLRQQKQQKQKQTSKSEKKERPAPLQTVAGYVDTHCHLDYIFQKCGAKSVADLAQMMSFPSNLEGMISVFCDPAAYSPSLTIWEELLSHPLVWGAFGIHPHNAKYYNDSIEQSIIKCLQHPKAVAWGETGLDFHYNNSPPDVQRMVFRQQLARAVEIGKPIVVHSRNADDDTYNIMKEFVPKDWRVHLHCFNESSQHARRMLTDFPNVFLGFTGAITFPASASLRDTIRDVVPLDRILLETDGPFMAPVPFRGAVAHPGHIPNIADQIAKLKGVSVDDVLSTTRKNSRSCYNI